MRDIAACSPFFSSVLFSLFSCIPFTCVMMSPFVFMSCAPVCSIPSTTSHPMTAGLDCLKRYCLRSCTFAGFDVMSIACFWFFLRMCSMYCLYSSIIE